MSMSVEELLPGVGSVTPLGAVTVAVFEMLPVADDTTVPVTTNVTVPLTARSTVVAILPDPLAAAHAFGEVAVHVQVTAVSAAGNVSATKAPVTIAGPLFVTTIVYVSCMPGTIVPEPFDFTISRSAVIPTVTGTLSELSPSTGSVVPAGRVTVAVFVIVPPGNDAATVASTMIVATPDTGRFKTFVIPFPVPFAEAHDPPAVVAHVHVTPVNDAGTVSVNVAPVTADGPSLRTVIVYVSASPG